MAALDETTALATSFDPNSGSSIKALAYDGSVVYAGGEFSSMGGDASRGFFMGLLDSSQTPLPVTLVHFTAVPVANTHIDLHWATAIELQNKGFEILRSEDGETFEKLGFVAGSCSKSAISNYSFSDKTALADLTYYYKLRQLDFDGFSTESEIRTARLKSSDEFNLNVFPNPVSTTLIINSGNSDASRFKFEMFDLSGRILISKISESGLLEIDLHSRPEGTYFYRLYSEGHVSTGKITVAH